MIDVKQFYDYLVFRQLSFFTGVPDSLLKDFCACVTQHSHSQNHITAANEGNAVAIAAGRYLSSGKRAVVYMQNSGLGNAVNPLLSLADEDVYQIPMLLMIGWRGQPGVKDEPQHVKQGKVTLPLLEAMGIPYWILDDDYHAQIDACCAVMEKESRPVALLVREGAFAEYSAVKPPNLYTMTREEALEAVLNILDERDFVVSTTGKTSREIFELREKSNRGHANDFLTVGSMGHTASIALGMSLGADRDIYCIDGDGSFLMHMGGFCIAAHAAQKNFKYILINNGAHESVGGQPTVGFDIDIGGILKAAGFKNVYAAYQVDDIQKYMAALKGETLSALIVYAKQGARGDLGRPTTTPLENKRMLMGKIADLKSEQ